jgi:hypothetical protein
MVALDEPRLQPRAALRIPVHGHHVGQVGGAAPYTPGIPIDQADAGRGTVAGNEEVPHVGVAVGERVGRIVALGRV